MVISCVLTFPPFIDCVSGLGDDVTMNAQFTITKNVGGCLLSGNYEIIMKGSIAVLKEGTFSIISRTQIIS